MLLKNSDIRVGNIIQTGNNGVPHVNGYGEIGKVLSIGNDEQEFEQVYCECSESFEWFFKDNYFGIPLNDEWHKKCGVEKNKFLEYVYDISRFCKKGITQLVFSGDYLYLRESESPNGIPSDLICLWNKDVNKEFYVHEFQNLYFFLTRKELEINNIFEETEEDDD